MNSRLKTMSDLSQHGTAVVKDLSRRASVLLRCLLLLGVSLTCVRAAEVIMDAEVSKSSVKVTQQGEDIVRVEWPVSSTSRAEVLLNLHEDYALIQSVGVAANGQAFQSIATQLDPVTILTIGERDPAIVAAQFRNMGFFEHLNKRRRTEHLVTLVKDRVNVISAGGDRLTVRIGHVTAGSFSGDFQLTFYPGSPLIHAETVISTKDELRAITYDTGLSSAAPDWKSFAWMDPLGVEVKRASLADAATATSQAVKFRAMVAEGGKGSLAVFALPHQYLYPLDEAENLKFTWYGRGYRGLNEGTGFGIRQPLDGDKRFVPWFDAPAKVEHRLGVFYLLSAGDSAQALREIAAFTHGDRFKAIPGYRTFTSHFHVEHTLNYLAQQEQQKTQGIPASFEDPGFVRLFKDSGVDIAHLAEFHRGPTPKMRTAERLKHLDLLHSECARLSDTKLLVLPGEEPNVHLGGHWLSFFPKPVNWVLNRAPDEPFVEELPGQGKVYHVGSKDDVLKLMQLEHGLMWTAHARIKGSRDFPDGYRDEDFFKSDSFLGAAWKSMPANLSRRTLGWRVLDLFDDMNTWGQHKQVLGEVDVFRLEPGFEFYSHANINYLKLPETPKFADGWQPVLDVLRRGEFFVTTGEVLIPKFTIGGKESGQTIQAPGDGALMLKTSLEWTYPLAFAEIVMGRCREIIRQRIDLRETSAFGSCELEIPVKLNGMNWARFEVWDIAANGAFTQPVWIK